MDTGSNSPGGLPCSSYLSHDQTEYHSQTFVLAYANVKITR